MMAKMLMRKSWPFLDSDIQSIDEGKSEDLDELPLPEEDEELIDTRFIHWGYLNCCHTVSKGKKVKREKWNTYWVDLCGSTLRFYKDLSLHIESHLSPPPTMPHCIAEEYESKVAFFELEHAAVRMLPDGQPYHRKSKKSVSPKIFRRHLFQLKLRNIRSTYVFQAPSHSAMLRWVSKIQESLDAIENNIQSLLAEERLKLAQDMVRKKSSSLKDFETIEQPDGEDGDASIDAISVVTEAGELHNIHPILLDLRKRLAAKQEQLMQFETQIIDFLGNKGDFQRSEFVCCTKQDYFLVAGRMDTFIPAGTKVNIFGQLPNRRWRCLVEMNELIKVMNELVEELKLGPDGCRNEKKVAEKETSSRNDLETLENLLNNIPSYPMLGCIPTSVLDIDNNETCPSIEVDKTGVDDNEDMEDSEKTSPKKVSISDITLSIDENIVKTTDSCQSHNNNYLDAVDAPTLLNIGDLKIIGDDVSPTEESESGSDPEDEVPVLRNFGTGILIRKKLRQKGLSIIVGSSSSEDEGEREDNDNGGKLNGVTNVVYQKFLAVGSSKKNEDKDKSWSREDKGYIRSLKNKEFKQSFSCDNIGSKYEFTTNRDMLERFGQESINFEEDKALAKALIQVFDETKKGPDVKPPRNDRRTLKLSKSDDQGYGFWLQTYDFGKNGCGKKRTFVRYVEDEGPAYLAGLREGDVIIAVNNQNVEELEHMKIVGLISETAKQLMLVVKFMDMVRRVELAVKLKKNQTKLKLKIEELEKIKEDERNLLADVAAPAEHPKDDISRLSNYSSSYSGSLEGDLDRLSLDTSSESGLGSLSSISDEVVVRTSKFDKRSSRVLDSIKELNCSCASPGVGKSDFNSPSVTTDNDLLNMYSESIGAARNKNGISINRCESMPVQKRESFPLRDFSLEIVQRNIKEQVCEESSIQSPSDHVASGDEDICKNLTYANDEHSRNISYKKANPMWEIASTSLDT